KGNCDPSGVGRVSSTLHQAVHRTIHVEISVPEHPLDFHHGGERLAIDLTLLNRKCVGQKLLERFLIDAGMVTHTAVTGADVRCELPCFDAGIIKKDAPAISQTIRPVPPKPEGGLATTGGSASAGGRTLISHSLSSLAGKSS